MFWAFGACVLLFVLLGLGLVSAFMIFFLVHFFAWCFAGHFSSNILAFVLFFSSLFVVPLLKCILQFFGMGSLLSGPNVFCSSTKFAGVFDGSFS